MSFLFIAFMLLLPFGIAIGFYLFKAYQDASKKK